MSQTINDGGAMTAAEVRRNCREINALLGGSKAETTMLIGGGGDGRLLSVREIVTVLLFPEGTGGRHHCVIGTDYASTFALARDWAVTEASANRIAAE